MSLLPDGSGQGVSSPADNQAKRRAFQRFSWKGKVSIRVLPSGPDLVGVLHDLSERGCGVELGLEIPAHVGDHLNVDLYLEGVTLKRKGIIRHIRLIRDLDKETRVGIEFLDDGDPVAHHFRLMTKGLLTRAGENRSTDEG